MKVALKSLNRVPLVEIFMARASFLFILFNLI